MCLAMDRSYLSAKTQKTHLVRLPLQTEAGRVQFFPCTALW